MMNKINIMEVEMQPTYEIIEVTSILEAVLKLDIYCAGDTLVNTALNLPIEKIDLYTFVDPRFIPVMLYKLEGIFNISIENNIEKDKTTFFESEVYSFNYKDKKCRLIFLKTYKTIEELITSFDLSIRQIGYFNNKFYISQKGYTGLNDKKVEIDNLDLIEATIERCKHYEDLGYKIVNKSLLDNGYLV